MAKRQIAVTGFGINSALGNGIEANKLALEAGKSGIVSTQPTWEQHKFKSLVAGNIVLDGLKEIFDRKLSRFLGDPALLAAACMKDAIKHSGLTDEEVQSPDTGIIVGTGAGASITDVLFMCQRLEKRGAAKVGAYHVPLIMGSSLSANLGSIFQIHGHSYTITSACATSAHAIMIGMDTIRSGRQNRVFVGGSEDINIYSAGSFDGMNALSSAFNDTPEKASRPLDKARDGFVFSGGAGILVLEELEMAKARGWSFQMASVPNKRWKQPSLIQASPKRTLITSTCMALPLLLVIRRSYKASSMFLEMTFRSFLPLNQ